MSLFRKIQNIKAQIIDTERLFELVKTNPLMSYGLEKRLKLLKEELESFPKISYEPQIKLLFSGNAVFGTNGIKSTFISKTLTPFQEMIKTQVALVRFGKVGERGQIKKSLNTELYLTALPVGSFGVELSQLESDELFDNTDISRAMKDVMNLIINSSIDDETFEASVEETPKRNLINLGKFLKEIVHENSFLKMESNDFGKELTKEKIVEAFLRVSSTIDEENEVVMRGIFRGLLLDSGKFEIQNEEGKRLSGFMSQDIYEEQLIEYDKKFLNKNCIIHLKIHTTQFKTGNKKINYELIEIKSES